jgi:hypothetical protein
MAERFARLPTAAKLLLILTAVLLPIGIALAWIGNNGIHQANSAMEGRAEDQARAAATGIESLVARNALALRVATNAALAVGPSGACDRARRALAIVPAVAQSFELETGDGDPICATGTVGDTGSLPLVAPGDIKVRIAPGLDAVAIRVGVIGGMATALVPVAEIRTAAIEAPGDIAAVVLHDDARELRVYGPPPGPDLRLRIGEWNIGNGALQARIGAVDQRFSTRDRLVLLLPLLMWIAAAIITWSLVGRLLVRPLKRLQRAVLAYRPGEGELELPRRLGPSHEIQELRD